LAVAVAATTTKEKPMGNRDKRGREPKKPKKPKQPKT